MDSEDGSGHETWPECRAVDPESDQDHDWRAAVMSKLGDSKASPQQQPGLTVDPDSSDEDEDFASADASAPSFPRPSFQRAKGGTKSLRIQPRVQPSSASAPGRTPIPTRPFIVRSIPKHTTAPLAQEQTTRLLRSLT